MHFYSVEFEKHMPLKAVKAGKSYYKELAKIEKQGNGKYLIWMYLLGHHEREALASVNRRKDVILNGKTRPVRLYSLHNPAHNIVSRQWLINYALMAVPEQYKGLRWTEIGNEYILINGERIAIDFRTDTVITKSPL